MLPIPKKYTVTAAAAEGYSKLNAFDNALLKAGIGNINLLRVSSILPPSAVFTPDIKFPLGALVPTAYGYIMSDIPGEIIAAAVGVGISKDTFGVIMEYAGHCSREEAYQQVQKMLQEAFDSRGMELVDTKIEAVEHKVEKTGACLAAVPLWY